MNKLPLIEKGESYNFKFGRRGGSAGLFYFFSLGFIVVFIFIILGLRLFQLTIVKGNYYARLSEENRIREIVIEPQRGKIVDRDGVALAQNAVPNTEESQKRYFSKRIYSEPEAVAPFIGYRQLADKNDLDNDPCINKAETGDKVGKKGLEKIYDCELRGKNGKKLLELDARGNVLKTLSIISPEAGKTIQTSLDLDLQKKAHELLNPNDGRMKGAIVALKPQTGEVLAFYSSPAFSSQDFEDNNQSKLAEYLKSDGHPLFNRASEGVYPPGSIFKIFVAAGALEDETIDEKYEFEDKGEIKAGPLTFGNWYFLDYGRTEGVLNIVRAIKRSTDTFFYTLGGKMGPEKMKFWADKFGLGRRVDVPLEQSEGTLPSPYWKEETLKERWYLGDTYNMSIGQGYLLVTPLQIAMGTAPFANGGKLCSPSLLRGETNDCLDIHIEDKNLELVRQGMREACSTGGTGWPLFDFGYGTDPTSSTSAQIKVQTACKTGTAESHGVDPEPHAWITVFAPYENPEIVVTVLVENSGQGSDIAGPIARDILKTYFEQKR